MDIQSSSQIVLLEIDDLLQDSPILTSIFSFINPIFIIEITITQNNNYFLMVELLQIQSIKPNSKLLHPLQKSITVYFYFDISINNHRFFEIFCFRFFIVLSQSYPCLQWSLQLHIVFPQLLFYPMIVNLLKLVVPTFSVNLCHKNGTSTIGMNICEGYNSNDSNILTGGASTLIFWDISLISQMKQGCLVVILSANSPIFRPTPLPPCFCNPTCQKIRQIWQTICAYSSASLSPTLMSTVLARLFRRQLSILVTILMVQVTEKGLPRHLKSLLLSSHNLYAVKLNQLQYCLCLSYAACLEGSWDEELLWEGQWRSEGQYIGFSLCYIIQRNINIKLI